MVQELPARNVVIFSDGGQALAASFDDDEKAEVMTQLVEVLENIVNDVLKQQTFRHVDVYSVPTDADDLPEGVPSALCIGFADSARLNEDGEQELSDFNTFVDLQGLLTGAAAAPKSLDEKVESEDAMVKFTDEELAGQVQKALRQARAEKAYERYVDSVGVEALQDALGDASDAALQGEAPQSEFDPFSVVELAVAHMVEVAGASLPLPSLFGRGAQAVGSLFAAPRAGLSHLRKRVGGAQRLWWRLEDLAVDGGKFAVKFAFKAARPVLVGLVLHKALRTIEDSRSPSNRLANLPPAKRMDYYYSKLLGKDWREQMEEDMAQAMKDVDEGLITEEISAEKRLMSAAMLRRLELEDWDKERMKNFYLASYGGLKWFEFMENALHNPLFITTRGWTDPVENWIGRQQTFPNDIPRTIDGDVGEYALTIVEKNLGRPLSSDERDRILSRAELRGSDWLAGTPLVPAAPAPAH